jgi:hypothetical protein
MKIDLLSPGMKIILGTITSASPIAVAARSKAWVCGRSLTGIAGSNGRSQWPRGLRRGSVAARLLGLRVRMADRSGRAV